MTMHELAEKDITMYMTVFMTSNPIPIEIEEAISENAESACSYAWIRSKRFPMGEPAIARNSVISVKYAITVLGYRFILGEEAIRSNRDQWEKYRIRFLPDE